MRGEGKYVPEMDFWPLYQLQHGIRNTPICAWPACLDLLLPHELHPVTVRLTRRDVQVCFCRAHLAHFRRTLHGSRRR